MATYTNFFETLQEAQMRLQSTIVVYDGEPYCVYQITDHRNDGVFRMYMYPVDIETMKDVDQTMPSIENFLYTPEGNGDRSKIGGYLDKWMESHPKSPFIRKTMNSPAFNKFRPFPLGMVNWRDGSVFYVERQPTRKSEQGLTGQSVEETRVSLGDYNPPGGGGTSRGRYTNAYTQNFADMIRGKYPTAQECIDGLLDKEVINSAAAFHRLFAFVRGPVGTIFLAYKGDIIGILPLNNFETVTIGRKFKQCREVVEALGVFGHVSIQG